MKYLEHFGQSLKDLRNSRRLTYEEAALKSGLAKSTIQRIESGDTGITIGTLITYFTAFGPDASEILNKHLLESVQDEKVRFRTEERKAEGAAYLMKLTKKA